MSQADVDIFLNFVALVKKNAAAKVQDPQPPAVSVKRYQLSMEASLKPEEAEKLLREYLEKVTGILDGMKDSPRKLQLRGLPDSRFLSKIHDRVLRRLPTFKVYHGKKYPKNLSVSKLVFHDGSGNAVLDIIRLRRRVLDRNKHDTYSAKKAGSQ